MAFLLSKKSLSRIFGVYWVIFFAGVLLPAKAGSFLIPQPAGDKWMYWFGDASGSRGASSVYGAYGVHDYPEYDFDDRHAQMFLDFDTSNFVEAGKGAQNYQIDSLVVTVVANYGDVFRYDPTFDSLQTYLNESLDMDLGRPIEIYGVGYRGGMSRATFRENSPYQNSGANKGTRNAFPIDFINGQPTDVSNNVERAFEVRPWAIGQINGALDLDGTFLPGSPQPGDMVPMDAVFSFAINLTDPLIKSYIQDGLHAGRLHFMLTSLYPALQQVSNVPSFHTKESYYHRHADYPNLYLAAQLEAVVTVSTNSTSSHKPELAISRLSNSSFRISFSSLSGFRYQLEFKNSLGDAEWTTLGDILNGDGSVLSFDDVTAAGRGSRFYRIKSTLN